MSSEPCPHRSVPVEMDESMTPSSLDLALPSYCNQCSGHTEPSKRPQDRGCEPPEEAAHDVSQLRPPESQYQHESRGAYQAYPELRFIPPTHSGQMKPPHPADDWRHGLRDQAQLYEWDHIGNQRRCIAGNSSWSQDHSVEEAECLETPLPLMSDMNYMHPSRYTAAGMPVQCVSLRGEI